jgi:transcriptional regulator with XRE-family HTH domain
VDTLGSRLKIARIQAGLTQTQLAEKAGVAQSDISKLERGDMAKTTGLPALARALLCDVDWLDTGEGDPDFGRKRRYWPLSAELQATVARLQPDALLRMENMLRATFGMKAIEELEPSIVRANAAIDLDQGQRATGGESLTDEHQQSAQTVGSRKAGARSLTSVPERAPVWPADKSLLGPRTAPPKEDGAKHGSGSKHHAAKRK